MKLTTEENFAADVLAKNFVVVDFSADWCGPCRMITPILDEIHDEMGVEFVQVNIDNCGDIASEYGIMSIPTLAIFKRGEKISVTAGAASKARLVDWIKSHLD
ncbi:MAG: thioredoxin [Holosporaceae bacterium]|jgi:thioredoxin 1|nr:thioredoxin [Holosporaceae bacterium]